MLSASMKQLICFLLGPLACFYITHMSPLNGMEQAGMLNLGPAYGLLSGGSPKFSP